MCICEIKYSVEFVVKMSFAAASPQKIYGLQFEPFIIA